MTAFLDAWRRQHPRAFRLGFWYVLGAVSLTALWLAALGVAPDPGLTRSYWHPIEGETESVVEERVTAIDLEFIDEQDRSTRDYRVRWEGVWFSPQAERVDFYAGADDRVILRVDGEAVLERNPGVGMHTVARTVELEAGAHQLQVDYWQDGGGAYLNVQGAPAGGAPGLLSPARLFAEDPGALGYWLRVAAARLPLLVLLVWTTGVAVLVLVAAGRAIYRRVTNLGADELWRRLRTVLFPALLGPSQILLFGPWTVHDTNRTEFLVGFWELAPGWAWLLAPITGTLVAVGLVLPARWFSRYVATLCAAGVLIWAQGSLLLADYGLLDGGALDLASHEWRTPYEAALWVGVLVLAVVFADVVMRAAPVTSVALVALQATVLVLPVSRVATLDTPPTRATETEWRLPPPEIFELSSTRNIIHIVLDTFPTHTFADILDDDRSSFDRDWSGFTFFANHLGTHRTTLISLPAMLSGVPFGNDMPFPEFVAQHPTVFNTLGQQGYQLRSLNAYVDVPGVDTAIQYEVPTPYGSYRDYVDVTAARLLDLSLFRHAPHRFKPAVYGDGRWFLQQRIESGPWLEAMAAKPFGNTVFLREFADRIIQGDDAPVYLFLQAYTPHLPIVTDADCAYAPSPTPHPQRFADQARCALSAVRMLLQRLRDLDLYDRSAIIVSSDHGIDLAYIGARRGASLGRNTVASRRDPRQG